MNDEGDVDWEALHARIARARVATEVLLKPDAAAERRTLDQRAARLARPLSAPEARECLEFVLFGVGREQYAIETQYVHRITKLPAFEPIPCVSLPFLGVLNHLGQPLPLIDLRALLQSPGAVGWESAPLSLLLVIGNGRDELGLAISAAEAVTLLPLTDIEGERLPDGLHGVPFIRGVYQGRRLVLAGSLLLDDPRLTLGDAS